MQIEFNKNSGLRTLMIHSFQSKILNGDTSSELNLDNIIDENDLIEIFTSQ